MPLTDEPSLAELIEAVRAEDGRADLTGAVRRSGDQNFVLETAQWIYRFPRAWIDLDREVAVLAALDGRLPVEIPRVEWVGRRSRCCAYRKITGRPFEPDSYRAASRPRQHALAASMAEYLIALHGALTEAEIAAIGIPDFFTLEARAGLIDLQQVPEEVRSPVAGMLARGRELSGRLEGRVLLDNDFTSDNIVLDEQTGLLHGVWDFSGVSVGPASFDFRALLRDPDPLTEDVVREYENRTGRPIERDAYVIAFRITDLMLARLRDTPKAPFLGRVVELAVEAGHDQRLLVAGVGVLRTFLDENKQVLRQRFGTESPVWVPNRVDDAVFARAYSGLQHFLDEVAEDPDHPLRKDATQRFRELVQQLRQDPEMEVRVTVLAIRHLRRGSVDVVRLVRSWGGT